ncbi:MAG: hypothetical protein H0U76_00545 [Ktedonobacteraceae bacterium]|nr:hypothetical protein [Ktedonobacteraceae bacterium]MBA3825280.1 hypothetical protein [Ktedonobacterales bacterium]
MRHGRAPSTPPHHRTHSLSPQALRRMLWRGVLALVRRPLLALTLGLVMVLLVGTVSEALAARTLERHAAAQHWHNANLREQLTHTAQQIRLSQSPAAITAAALRLGMASPATAP